MDFTVIVKTYPGSTETFNSTVPITVERAANFAKIEMPENWSASIGGEEVSRDTLIDKDTTLILIKKMIKGNLLIKGNLFTITFIKDQFS